MRPRSPKPTPVVSKLERVTRGGRRILSIERSDCSVVVTEAKVGELGRPKLRTYLSPEAAEHAVRELEASLAGKGYSPLRPPPGSTAVRGRVARDPDLERAIEDDLDDDAGFLVYADWLSAQGDVRGELIRAQLELEQHPGDKQLTTLQDALLSKFAKELLGPLAKHSIIRDPNAYLPGFRWRRGFICAARLWRFSRAPTMEGLLSTLLEHPAGRFLERLVLDVYKRQPPTSAPSLTAPPPPPPPPTATTPRPAVDPCAHCNPGPNYCRRRCMERRQK